MVKKQYLFIIIIISTLLVTYIGRLPRYYSSISLQNGNLKKTNDGFLFAVAIDNRYHCLAKKISKHEYTLEYINKIVRLKRCQVVRTTGLDDQFSEDIIIGYISDVLISENDIYQNISVRSNVQGCKIQEL